MTQYPDAHNTAAALRMSPATSTRNWWRPKHDERFSLTFQR